MATLASASPSPIERGDPDSAFEASTLDTRREGRLDRDRPTRWIGWRLRLLVLAALLGCLSVFSLARWQAGAPALDADWAVDANGRLVLTGSDRPDIDAHRGQALRSLSAADAGNAGVD
ncbi:MAG: hypothetical protein H7Z19_18585, partial [Chitinophagaceae bacterium]|nr:hypothetical protein [Rubrivivax sp.]